MIAAFTSPETLVALAIAAIALFVALAARSRAARIAASIEDLERELRRRSDGLADEVESALRTQRALLARVAAGERLEPAMIEEGRLWRELTPQEGLALVTSEAQALVVDVRTPQEHLGGILPGAICIPLDELEARATEIPHDERPKLVYCAGGGRSAAACEYLSSRGVGGLHNLAGGISSWPGPLQRS